MTYSIPPSPPQTAKGAKPDYWDGLARLPQVGTIAEI